MNFFDQWLLRLILASLLAAIPFLLYTVLIYYRPRAFSGRQKRRFWLALFFLLLLSLPLPRLLPLPQTLYQFVSVLRLPSLQTPRLTGYQLNKAERDLNALATVIYDDNQGAQFGSGEYENASYISRQTMHQVLDSVERTLPWLRWLYPAGLLMLTAVLIYRNRNNWRSLKKLEETEKPVPGTQMASDAKSVPGTKTASQKSQRISEWAKVVNAWRDELGYYRRCTILVNSNQNYYHSIKDKLQRVVTVPDRWPMEQDLPDYWRKQEFISAPVAIALYDLQHPDLLLTGLYKLVRFITWFNPLWLWIGAAYRSDRQQACQEALAARLRRQNGAIYKEKSQKPVRRSRPRLADAVLPVCLVVIAAALLIQMPGLIVPAYQPLSRTQERLFPDASDWQIEYQFVSDNTELESSMFASYQVSESYLNDAATFRYIAAHRYIDNDAGSADQNITEKLAIIEKRDSDNQLIWQLDLHDSFTKNEIIVYPFINELREMDNGSCLVLCRVLGILTDSGDNQEQHFTYYYVFQIAKDGRLMDYYRLDNALNSNLSFTFLDNGDLLQVERLRLSESRDPHTRQYQFWLTRYNKQGQIVWQNYDQQLDRSEEENRNSGIIVGHVDPVLLVAADRQGGFYLVLQDQLTVLSTQPSPSQSKFLRSLNGTGNEQINPYSSSVYLPYSLATSPRYTSFKQPARIIHYNQSGQQINQMQLQQNQSTVFVPQQGFVTVQDELILTGRAVDQELCGMLTPLRQHLQHVDQKRLQSAISDASLSLMPAEQFSEAYIHAQIVAISPEQGVIWNKIFPGFSSSVLDYLSDSTGFTVLIEEPLPILDIDNIMSSRFPAGPLYGSIYNSAFPYSSVYNTYLQSRQHLVRFDLTGHIEAWQTIETDKQIDPDINAVVTAVFVDNDRIICQMK